jgi:hypothetical protein
VELRAEVEHARAVVAQAESAKFDETTLRLLRDQLRAKEARLVDARPSPNRVVAAKRLLRDANRAVLRKTITVAGIEGLLARTLESLDIERFKLRELIDVETGAQRALTEAVEARAKEDAKSNAELVSETKSLAE